MADGGVKLSEIYDKCWEIFQYLESTDDPCCEEKYQNKVATGQKQAELGICMVNHLQIFSTNEDFEEITSNEIRYMTLSALCANFWYKDMRTDRLIGLDTCKTHLINFLRLCKNYGITSVNIPEQNAETSEDGDDQKPSHLKSPAPGSQEEIIDMAEKRRIKIDRFRKQKEDEKRLKELYEKVKEDHVDDEIKREYYSTLLQKFIHSSIEDLDAIEQELPMVKRMAELGGPGNAPPREKPKTDASKQFTPFILTKNDLQKRVFGMGYTNLPTYSIDEFYEKEAAAGRLPSPGDIPAANPTPAELVARDEEQAEEKEKLTEVDDADHLRKQREWEEWTDDHRRGWGNRQNMG